MMLKLKLSAAYFAGVCSLLFCVIAAGRILLIASAAAAVLAWLWWLLKEGRASNG